VGGAGGGRRSMERAAEPYYHDKFLTCVTIRSRTLIIDKKFSFKSDVVAINKKVTAKKLPALLLTWKQKRYLLPMPGQIPVQMEGTQEPPWK
jgi:hypothetical protein